MTYNKIIINLKKLDIASSSQLEKHDIAFWWANKYKEIKANEYLNNKEKEVIINEINIARDELLEIEIAILKNYLKLNVIQNNDNDDVEKKESVKTSEEQNQINNINTKDDCLKVQGQIQTRKFYNPPSAQAWGFGTIFLSIGFFVSVLYEFLNNDCPFRDRSRWQIVDDFVKCEGQVTLVFFILMFGFPLLLGIGIYLIDKKAFVLEISSREIKTFRNFLHKKFYTKRISLNNIKKAVLEKKEGLQIVKIYEKNTNKIFDTFLIEKPHEVVSIINNLVDNKN